MFMSRRSPPADKAPKRGDGIDDRTRRARRRRKLIEIYSNSLGGDAALSATQKIDIAKAAELVALSEASRALFLRDGPGTPGALSAMIRLESASVRAVRALGIKAPNSVAPGDNAFARFMASQHAGDG
jgi:hypothetical protein